VIDWDEEFMVPVNWHTYAFDLVEANKDGNEPKWFAQHDAIKEYNLTDLSPSNMKNFAYNMYNDSNLAS
jgi:hypothetical protein